MSGWIKLQRDIMDHWIAQDPEYLSVWIRMLSEANFEARTVMFNGQLINVARGDFIFGLDSYHAKTKVSVMRLRRLIKLLEKDKMINRVIKPKYSVISIVNYDKYQSDNTLTTGSEQGQNKHRTSTEQAQNNTIRSKESKEVKKKENNVVSAACESTDVFEHWKELMKHPKAKLDPKRITLIRKALKLGYTVDELKSCITGYTHSPFHMGDNDRRTRYDNLELILRDAGKIDFGLRQLELAHNGEIQHGYQDSSKLNRHERLQVWAIEQTAEFERQLAELDEQERAGAGDDGHQDLVSYVSTLDP